MPFVTIRTAKTARGFRPAALADRVGVFVDGIEISRRHVVINAPLHGCLRAYVELPVQSLNIQQVDGFFYTEILGRRYRLECMDSDPPARDRLVGPVSPIGDNPAPES
jgi:hypothetical protein